ncbi:hypothetical protein [Actinopolymorpha pittospori]
MTVLASSRPFRLVYRLHSASHLPGLARERVTSTTLARGYVPFNGHNSAYIMARRAVGSAEVVWLVALENELDTDDAAARAAVDAALESFRSTYGI